jgi:hypothetical protein
MLALPELFQKISLHQEYRIRTLGVKLSLSKHAKSLFLPSFQDLDRLINLCPCCLYWVQGYGLSHGFQLGHQIRIGRCMIHLVICDAEFPSAVYTLYLKVFKAAELSYYQALNYFLPS